MTEENKINFDLSTLTLEELVEVYENIEIFLDYLEESKISFEEQSISDQQYYQCCTLLGTVYLDYYLQDRTNRLAYLRKSRSIERMLSPNWFSLGKAQRHAAQLRTRLKDFGNY